MGALYAFNKIEEISLNDGLENIGQGAFDNGNNSYTAQLTTNKPIPKTTTWFVNFDIVES